MHLCRYEPDPDNVTVCGEFTALDVITIDEELGPVAVGVLVTEIEQLPPTATEGKQLLVWE